VDTKVETRGNEPLLLRIHPDVTGLTRLGRTTIYNEIACGRLRAVHVGRAVRVRRDDLERWLDMQTQGAQVEPIAS
jgi:excisionase family DNA binding protein